MPAEAVYGDGVLKPLQPLDLTEHEHVVGSVTELSAEVGPSLDVEFLGRLKTELQHAEPAPGLEAVRPRLAKIPGSMTDDFITERGDR